MRRKVLFVDDDQILRSALERRLLSHADEFQLLTAGDGFEAVKLLKEHCFSLVILDLVMPRMDGMSLLAHLQEHYPDIPAIIVTAMPSDQLAALAAQAGVVKAFPKPFQAAQLLAAIESILRQEAEGGIMYSISPTVFLQLMEMDGKSCTIRILDNASTQGGILYFREGRLLDARIGQEKGAPAALRVFTMETATIFVHNSCPPMDDQINSDLTPIIMRAVSLRDEAEASDHFADDEFGDELESPPANADKVAVPAHFQLLLERLRTIMTKNLGSDFGLRLAKTPVGEQESKDRFQALGQVSGLQHLRAAITDGPNDTYRLMLPSKPPLWLELDSSCPRDDLCRLMANLK